MTARKTRRRFLQTSTVVGGVALAGCLGGDDDNGDDENGDDGGDGTEAAFASASPVCHDYTQDGQYAYVTLGPGYGDGGLLVFDFETFEIVEEFPDIPANCGTIAHPEEAKFYVNAGRADVDGADPAGEWWVFDTDEHRPINPETGEADEDYDLEAVTRDSNGYDTHGVWFTPDNEELWMVNRDTDDGFVVDPETDEVIDEIENAGTSPDILTASPDGEYMFATTRGPDQQSGPHAIAGDEPGVAVLDVESRELVQVIEPDPIDDYADEDIEADDVAIPDFHGIGLVPGDSDDDYELWAVDQGTATLYVIEPDGDDFTVTDEIDLGDGLEETPHMVDYDSEFRYGVIPSTSGAKTQIVRVDDYEIVAELDTGAGSHFAGVNPDDESILVDVIGDEKFVEIDADFEGEAFEISQELVLSELEQFPGGE
ncbi:YncE family protein [Natronorubrum sp. DTA7]|uniref:YncE family protein n=1 Tax=Natronorubrum sp. DTA7 TaxID=3447016 RepID=UPI003F85B361